MKFSSLRSVPIALAVIAVFVVFAARIDGGPRSVEADVDSVSPDAMFGSSGATIDIDIAGDEDATDGLGVAATGSSTLDNGACTDEDGGDCGAESGSGNPVTWGTVDGPYTATAILTLSCTDVEAVTVTATHNGDSTPVATVYCVPNLNDEDVEIEKQSDDNGSYTFDWDASGGDCLVFADDGTIDFDNDGSFDLEDNEEAQFFCESSVNLTIDERDDNDFVAIDDCDHDDGVSIHGSTAEFDISDLDFKAFCTWINDDDFHVTPTVVVGLPTSISVVLTSSTVNCGGSTLIQVSPRSTGGPVAAGTTLVMTSSLGGSFQPSSTITSQFPVTLANFLYTAPADANGTTTITARAGNVQRSVLLQIVCNVQPEPTSTPLPLAPPSAGDGGLLGSSGPSYLPLALAIAAAAAVFALTIGARRFAFATNDIEGISTSGASESSTRPSGFALLASLVMLAVALLTRRWR